MKNKIINLMSEIGTILYVGGILSHIIIGVVLGHESALTAYHVGIYKENSAYILILPGLALKAITDCYYYYSFDVKPNWIKAKLLLLAFLSINAFVFLVPMMPELVALAKDSIPNGVVSDEYLEKAELEQYIGMSNAIPLLLEILIGSLKPKLFNERKQASMAE